MTLVLSPLFEGSACALITPFTESGKDVDYAAMAKILQYQMQNHTDAIVVCGTTGEASCLTDEERKNSIALCMSVAGGGMPVIAGTGSNNTENAVRLSNEAEKQGVNGLLIVTPYYNKCSQNGIEEHYRFIDERISTPFLVYNVPSRTGVHIKSETYAQLSKLKHIAGIKEASGDISSVITTRSLCPEIPVYSGNDDQTIPIMSAGGMGVISVMANLFPDVMHQITTLCKNGQYEKAMLLQNKYTSFMHMLFEDVNPIPIKYAMSVAGLCTAQTRLPLTPCSKTLKNKISAFLQPCCASTTDKFLKKL